MINKEELLKLIEEETSKIDGELNSKKRNIIQRKLYKHLPQKDYDLITFFDELVTDNDWHIFWIITQWIKRKKLYNKEYMEIYEKWLYNYISTWGSCDVYCYRVLNPMLEIYPEYYKNVIKWSDSKKPYVRRAAPVSLLESTRSFKVNYSFQKVIKIVNKLKDDQHYRVQKGVGWLLKYTYLSYPDKTYDYLKNNVDNLNRIIFRYALEKTPQDIKNELMNL
ncbi:MAG: DNA alkylation repair protein [Bacillota bacterium]